MNNFYKILSYAILPIVITACLSQYIPGNSATAPEREVTESMRPLSNSSEPNIILMAEQKATPSGKKVLATGRKMIADGLILPGGCWDYINEVYNRAGYPNNRQKRQTVFKGTQHQGPYAHVSLIQPGDFLYYVNHSYHDIEHSAIFVDWLDFSQKEALMLSYGGESRHEPARYLPYELSNVYRIVRAKN